MADGNRRPQAPVSSNLNYVFTDKEKAATSADDRQNATWRYVLHSINQGKISAPQAGEILNKLILSTLTSEKQRGPEPTETAEEAAARIFSPAPEVKP